MTSKEKITSAQTSKNLGEKPHGELGDVDIIRACGMAGQANPLGLSVWRWRYAGDHRSMFAVAQGLVEMGHPEGVVYRVLSHLSNDVCKSCFGRGFEVIHGAPVLSDDVCVDCRGTGRRTILGVDENRLVEEISRIEREIAGAIMKKLATDLEF